jgi:hypothetical protein
MKKLHLISIFAALLATAVHGAPIAKGQRVFTCGHSFHVWVVPILTEMAQAAGIEGHEPAGVSSIGGSRVIQHWDQSDGKNQAKEALCAGKVDVLTLSPIWVVPQKDLPLGLPRKKGERDPNTAPIYWLPDDGIEKFARLGVEHNPEIRITVQEYWMPNDEYDPVYPLQTRKRYDHNATNLAELKKAQAAYDRDLSAFLGAINKQLGKETLYIVPVGQASVALREKIVAGQAPGLKEQTELFRDCWGHPQPPLQTLAAYCHFAVIYRRNPVGLPVPTKLAGQPEAEKLNCLLQQLAWDAVTQHPMSGVTK